jgi:hypothetical protein
LPCACLIRQLKLTAIDSRQLVLFSFCAKPRRKRQKTEFKRNPIKIGIALGLKPKRLGAEANRLGQIVLGLGLEPNRLAPEAKQLGSRPNCLASRPKALAPEPNRLAF